MGLEVQDPNDKPIFSSKDLMWFEIHRRNGTIERVAKIPSHRVLQIIKGEEMNLNAPCIFNRSQIKSPKKRDSVAFRYEVLVFQNFIVWKYVIIVHLSLVMCINISILFYADTLVHMARTIKGEKTQQNEKSIHL